MRTTCLRTFEVLFSLVVLILLSPLLCVIGLAIHLDSPGGALYRAKRVGLNGTPFVMFKFRTMVKDAAAIGPPITTARDPRLTRLGDFLRRTKLDELPQFINVLRGDMHIIGPRPEAPEIVATYSSEQRRILAFKPGITGKQQIEGEESDTIPTGAQASEYYRSHILDRKLKADLDYLEHRTIGTDLALIVKTAGVVAKAITLRLATR